MNKKDNIIVDHGGYRKMRSFVMAQLVYDLTVKFCDKYISFKSRTHDQMVQAARSGVQNIAEGSQTSGTSKKSEIRLTDVARASLEELKLDYEDFLRQNHFQKWERNNQFRQELVDNRYTKANEVINWVHEIHTRVNCKLNELSKQSEQEKTSFPELTKFTSCKKASYKEIAANTILTLTNVACYLLDRHLASLAEDFEHNGGFTERLYKSRSKNRNKF